MTSAAFNVSDVLSGYKWTGSSISFSFLTTAAPSYAPSGWQDTFGALSLQQMAAVRIIIADISQYINLTINELPVGEVGDITFGLRAMTDTGATERDIGGSNPNAGDVWLRSTFNSGVANDLFKSTVYHEILHALGVINHDAIGFAQGPDANIRFSAASNNTGQLGQTAGTSLQLYDISALQHLYGAPSSFHNGADVHAFGASNRVMSIWDTGGTDTLSAQGSGSSAILNLNATSFSSIGAWPTHSLEAPAKNISIARNVVIENAKGTNQTDIIIGNHVSNKLEGDAGSDLIFGDEVTARAIIPDSGELRGIFFDDAWFHAGVYQVNGTTSEDDNDEILAGDGEDWVFAGRGNDVVDGGTGNDFLDGGKESDVAKYEDVFGHINIRKLAPSAVPEGIEANDSPIYEVVFRRGQAGETDRLRDFELIEFGDGQQRLLLEGELTISQGPMLLDGGDDLDTLDLSHMMTGVSSGLEYIDGEQYSVVAGPGVGVRNIEAVVGTDFNDELRSMSATRSFSAATVEIL